jgi:hypothetical protein
MGSSIVPGGRLLLVWNGVSVRRPQVISEGDHGGVRLGGHLKTVNRWTGQNRPTEFVRDLRCLPCFKGIKQVNFEKICIVLLGFGCHLDRASSGERS